MGYLRVLILFAKLKCGGQRAHWAVGTNDGANLRVGGHALEPFCIGAIPKTLGVGQSPYDTKRVCSARPLRRPVANRRNHFMNCANDKSRSIQVNLVAAILSNHKFADG